MENKLLNIKDWGLNINLDKPIMICGPCSAESEIQLCNTAHTIPLIENCKIFRAGLWKPRTNPGGFEGLGAVAFPWLRKIKDFYDYKITVEIPNTDALNSLLENDPDLVDIIWIGARTTGDPFAVQAIVDFMKEHHMENTPVLIKNPISPDLDLWCGAINRFLAAGINKVGAIHRGFNTIDEKKYRNSPIWNIPLELKRRYPEITLICDPSHIAGNKDYIEEISQIALDFDFDGLMVETHCTPKVAWTDAKQQITAQELLDILNHIKILKDDKDVSKKELNLLRTQIDDTDNRIIEALKQRFELTNKVAEFKKQYNLPIFQQDRYTALLKSRMEKGNKAGLNEKFIEDLYVLIHEESIMKQEQIISE